jgi:uncharacterized protein with FMN-binding domain
MPHHRLSRELVALAASAISAVYAAGYVRTQAADALLATGGEPSTSTPGPPITAPVAAAPTTPPSPSPVAGLGPSASSAPTGASTHPQAPPPRASSPAAAPTRAPAPATSSSYKDGTYTGTGTSRRGNVSVSLSVQGGRVASVQITRVTTEYPVRDIASLPREVVQRQSAKVDVVSGATYSSLAFRAAVQQALQQAQA